MLAWEIKKDGQEWVPHSAECDCRSMHATLTELLELTGGSVSSTCQLSTVANATCQGPLLEQQLSESLHRIQECPVHCRVHSCRCKLQMLLP